MFTLTWWNSQNSPLLLNIFKKSSTREYENGENLKEPPLYHDLEEIVPENCHRSWVLIHTNDCDCYGMSLDVLHEINDIMNKEWTTEIPNPSYILGVRRALDTSDPKRWVITCTMPLFIEDLATVFDPDLDEAERGRRQLGDRQRGGPGQWGRGARHRRRLQMTKSSREGRDIEAGKGEP